MNNNFLTGSVPSEIALFFEAYVFLLFSFLFSFFFSSLLSFSLSSSSSLPN